MKRSLLKLILTALFSCHAHSTELVTGGGHTEGGGSGKSLAAAVKNGTITDQTFVRDRVETIVGGYLNVGVGILQAMQAISPTILNHPPLELVEQLKGVDLKEWKIENVEIEVYKKLNSVDGEKNPTFINDPSKKLLKVSLSRLDHDLVYLDTAQLIGLLIHEFYELFVGQDGPSEYAISKEFVPLWSINEDYLKELRVFLSNCELFDKFSGVHNLNHNRTIVDISIAQDRLHTGAYTLYHGAKKIMTPINPAYIEPYKKLLLPYAEFVHKFSETAIETINCIKLTE